MRPLAATAASPRLPLAAAAGRLAALAPVPMPRLALPALALRRGLVAALAAVAVPRLALLALALGRGRALGVALRRDVGQVAVAAVDEEELDWLELGAAARTVE